MSIEGDRLYKKLPEVSKSAIKTFKYFCSYLFWRNVILGEKEEEDTVTKRCDVGTDAHLIFAEFWSAIDADYVFTLEINPMLELDNNPVTYYFYGLCMDLTPKYDRDVPVLQRIFWKFAKLHAARFLYYYKLFNRNKMKTWKYFFPKEIEQFYNIKKFGIYGTVDTVFRDIDEKLVEFIYIPDYKTGNVPSSVLEGPKNIADKTSVKLPTKFMFETHFYGLLYLLHHGWYFNDDRVEAFLMFDEYKDEIGNWQKFGLGLTKEEQAKIDKSKKKYLTKIKPQLTRYNFKTQKYDTIKYGDILLGIIFLSGNPKIENPIVVKKKFNYSSLKNVLHRINEIKNVYHYRDYNQYYLIKKMKTRPEYNEYKCKDHCSRNKKCLKEIEREFKKGL